MMLHQVVNYNLSTYKTEVLSQHTESIDTKTHLSILFEQLVAYNLMDTRNKNMLCLLHLLILSESGYYPGGSGGNSYYCSNCRYDFDQANYCCNSNIDRDHGCQMVISRLYVFGPSGFWTMAPLRYAAKFDPFLSLDCARVSGNHA